MADRQELIERLRKSAAFLRTFDITDEARHAAEAADLLERDAAVLAILPRIVGQLESAASILKKGFDFNREGLMELLVEVADALQQADSGEGE